SSRHRRRYRDVDLLGQLRDQFLGSAPQSVPGHVGGAGCTGEAEQIDRFETTDPAGDQTGGHRIPGSPEVGRLEPRGTGEVEVATQPGDGRAVGPAQDDVHRAVPSQVIDRDDGGAIRVLPEGAVLGQVLVTHLQDVDAATLQEGVQLGAV